jgi:tricorn protease
MQKIVDQISGTIDATVDGKKILFRKGRDFFLVSADSAAKPDEGKQDFSKIEVRVVPAEEWRQMFHESMRIMRDWFYDPKPSWTKSRRTRERVRCLLADDRAPRRSQPLDATDARFRVSQPSRRRRRRCSTAGGKRQSHRSARRRLRDRGREVSLQEDLSFAAYSSPAGSFNAPLDQPGVAIREGDYLLRINDQPIEAEKNLLSYFENTVGKPTKITVSASANGASARTYTVFPALGENRLRRANWAEENRKLVEKLSGGRLGYIFIEGYSGDGIANAIRGLTGYADKQGIIVDQRFNGGGITPDYLIEWMQRKPLYYYMFRGGEDIATPVNPAPPVKVLIVNELNGSAAETGAFMFKLAKIGPIVGKRTFGGGIGPYYFTPQFIDGGQVRLPNRAAFDPSGSGWGIENTGVAPEFDVEITPADVIAGRDPQLEKAVEVALAQISKNPVVAPKHPAFPVHRAHKTGVAEAAGSSLPLAGSAFPVPAHQSRNHELPPALVTRAGGHRKRLFLTLHLDRDVKVLTWLELSSSVSCLTFGPAGTR